MADLPTALKVLTMDTFLKKNIRQRERARMKGAEGEGERISSRLHAEGEPDMRLNLVTPRPPPQESKGQWLN